MKDYEDITLEELEKRTRTIGALSHINIENDENDKLVAKELNITRSRLYNLGLREIGINTSRITQSIIEECYLRYSKFVNVDFTGTKFINCNLEKAKFQACTLRYVTFTNCILNIYELLANLPAEPNLKKSLLKELYKNEIQRCNKETADTLLIEIINVESEDLRARYKCTSSYYTERLGFSARIGAFIKYFSLKINDFIWGHGLKLKNLLISAMMIILLFALIVFSLKEQYTSVITQEIVNIGFWDSLYVSYLSFTGVGYLHFLPESPAAKIVFSCENFLGLIFIGFFTASIYRRISR